ncbi:hypothetical protein HQQ94_16305 [Shewanella sp. VB17]|uniref:hypothetical protein n=1 Tax=Shewanella sp. VB17 TaxID=2739432 RepID=UPI0015678506|nr:hypothetical protein [Shewanella sp. VB17]NRD74752.1 hypothetical protein [Shewanella sp. VB17]
MRVSVLLILVCCTGLINCVNANEGTVDPTIFKVNTLRLYVENDSTTPLPGAKLLEIKPIGRGHSSDLECEGISDDNGEMTCIVNNCERNSPLSSHYEIAIQAPNEFGRMTPAKVRIFHCEVTPKPASATFIEKTLIALKFNSDVNYVFGESAASILNGQASITIDQYTDKMTSLLKKPAGSFSAIKMRKIFQDYSFEAVNSNESSKANKYSGLTITLANVRLNEWAQQNGVSGVETNDLDLMVTLNMNIKKILEENSDNESVLVYKEELKFLRKSFEKGKLSNEQFKTLESISIK